MENGSSAPAKKQSLRQDELTSKDFYNDFSSSIRGQMSKLRDHAKVEAFSEAIERVKHSIRGKVSCLVILNSSNLFSIRINSDGAFFIHQ